MRTIQAVIDRARDEFMETPGLQLTVEQLREACGVDQQTAEIVLEFLFDTGFLRRTSIYARVDARRPSGQAAPLV